MDTFDIENALSQIENEIYLMRHEERNKDETLTNILKVISPMTAGIKWYLLGSFYNENK